MTRTILNLQVFSGIILDQDISENTYIENPENASVAEK